MKVHISLNVNDLSSSVEFYRKMLGSDPVKFLPADTEGTSPANQGYAKFDISNPPLNLALNERPVSRGEGLSHLGLQVESSDEVLEFKKRWEDSGLITAEEMDVICCYARQDKAWVRDPDGNEWEAFTVLENVGVSKTADAACCAGENVSGLEAAASVPGVEADTAKDKSSLPVSTSSCC